MLILRWQSARSPREWAGLGQKEWDQHLPRTVILGFVIRIGVIGGFLFFFFSFFHFLFFSFFSFFFSFSFSFSLLSSLFSLFSLLLFSLLSPLYFLVDSFSLFEWLINPL